MIIEIVYDNTAYRNDMKADWGFSAYLHEHKILFDTGANGKILKENMKKAGIEVEDIEKIFISHGHWDHVGGLKEILKRKKAKVYTPPSYMPNAKNVVVIRERMKIDENVFSTGELGNIEQSMVVRGKHGIIIIAGCSHPGIDAIINASIYFGKPYAIIGGFHDFDEYELLEPFEIICPLHCTRHKKEIKELYEDKYIEGGAGKIIEID